MGDFVAFTTSWDDGSPSDTRVADLLHSFGLLGTFYASTGPEGARSISDSDLRRIARDHELGNHGRTHTPFLSLSSTDIEDEVRWGDRELSRFGSPGKIVAPPKGKMDARVVRTLRELGYHVRSAPVLATRSRRATWFEPSLQFYPHTWSAITRNMARRRLLPAAPLLLTWARGGDFRQRTLDLVRVAAERLPCVHVWGHSWEIDQLDLWDALEDVFRLARALHIRPTTNTEAAAAATASPRGSAE